MLNWRSSGRSRITWSMTTADSETKLNTSRIAIREARAEVALTAAEVWVTLPVL